MNYTYIIAEAKGCGEPTLGAASFSDRLVGETCHSQNEKYGNVINISFAKNNNRLNRLDIAQTSSPISVVTV